MLYVEVSFFHFIACRGFTIPVHTYLAFPVQFLHVHVASTFLPTLQNAIVTIDCGLVLLRELRKFHLATPFPWNITWTISMEVFNTVTIGYYWLRILNLLLIGMGILVRWTSLLIPVV